LELLHGKLEEALEKCNNEPRMWWRSLESCLHAFQAIAECVDIEESRHVPRFLEALHRLPYHQLDTRVVITALEAIGKLYDLLYLPAFIERSEVVKNADFWDVMPCGSYKNRLFGGTYCLHHQGDKNR
jgi:hypothetical protein